MLALRMVVGSGSKLQDLGGDALTTLLLAHSFLCMFS